MRSRVLLFQLLVVAAVVLPLQSAQAGSDLLINNGQGEELEIKRPLLGKQVNSIKDRYANQLKTEKGLLGSKSAELSFFGNKIKKKKGLFGNTEYQIDTVFGDKLSSKKGIFGRRKTSVDLSGSTQAISGLQRYLGKRTAAQDSLNSLQ